MIGWQWTFNLANDCWWWVTFTFTRNDFFEEHIELITTIYITRCTKGPDATESERRLERKNIRT